MYYCNIGSTLVLASCYLCIHALYMQNYYKQKKKKKKKAVPIITTATYHTPNYLWVLIQMHVRHWTRPFLPGRVWLASFPGLPRFSRSSASVYYTERKPKNKKRGRPGNEARVWPRETIAGMGGAGAGGVVSQSSGSGSNSGRESRLRLQCFARFARFWIPVQLQYRQLQYVSTVTVSSKTSLGNLPYFSLRTNIL